MIFDIMIIRKIIKIGNNLAPINEFDVFLDYIKRSAPSGIKADFELDSSFLFKSALFALSHYKEWADRKKGDLVLKIVKAMPDSARFSEEGRRFFASIYQSQVFSSFDKRQKADFLQNIVSARDFELLEILSKKKLVDLNAKDWHGNDGFTLLMCFAANGDVTGVNALLKAGVKINEHSEWEGTALSYAAANGHEEIVRLLFETNDARNRSRSCLTRATSIDLNKKDDNGCSALAKACLGGHLSTALLLVDKGADTERFELNINRRFIKTHIIVEDPKSPGVLLRSTCGHEIADLFIAYCNTRDPAIAETLRNQEIVKKVASLITAGAAERAESEISKLISSKNGSAIAALMNNKLVLDWLIQNEDLLSDIRKIENFPIISFNLPARVSYFSLFDPGTVRQGVQECSEEQRTAYLNNIRIRTDNHDAEQCDLEEAFDEIDELLPPALFGSGPERNSARSDIQFILEQLQNYDIGMIAADSRYQKTMIKCISFLNPTQLKFAIPQLSEDLFVAAVQQLPLDQQSACIQVANIPQRKAYLKSKSTLIDPALMGFKGQLTAFEKRCERFKKLTEATPQPPELLKKYSQLKFDFEEMQYVEAIAAEKIRLEKFTKALRTAVSDTEYNELKAAMKLAAETDLQLLEKRANAINQKILDLATVAGAPEAIDVPDEFICPILKTIIKDPVYVRGLPQRHFERSAMERSVRATGKSPWTNQPMDLSDMCSDESMKVRITGFRLANPLAE